MARNVIWKARPDEKIIANEMKIRQLVGALALSGFSPHQLALTKSDFDDSIVQP